MEGSREAGDEPARASQRERLDWSKMDWARIKQDVEKMQREIFRHVRTKQYWKVNQFQKLLVRSLAARAWAVKIVTEINGGRNTPGIDGKLYKKDPEKVFLAEGLRMNGYSPDPVRIECNSCTLA